MKRIICFSLIAAMLALPVQRAQAPIPIWLAIALRCVAIGTLAESAYIICRCEPDWYLVEVRDPDDPQCIPYWIASQASAGTVAKNLGWTRWQGPSKDRKEIEQRAWENNQQPGLPMHKRSVLGKPLPPASYTNYAVINLQIKTGGQWVDVSAEVLDWDDNFSFAFLPQSGTNGMTRDQILQVQGCDAVTTNASPAAMFRFRYEQ